MTEIVLIARALILCAFGAGLLVGASTSAKGQSSFDGSWSVLIVTDSGNCDRAYRYGVRIERGRISYTGEVGIEFSGRVERDGRVAVTVRWGEQRASGTGRLTGNRGSGTWRGRSPTGECSGYWEAERR
jgi:hypothetical protein